MKKFLKFPNLRPGALLAILGISAWAAAPLAEAQDPEIYWTVDGPEIMGAQLDGSNVQTVFDGTGMAGTAVDVAVTADHIYWTDKNDTSGGGVWRANRDGSDAALFVSNPEEVTWAPQFIAIDEENGKVYFSDWYTGLYSADLATGENVVALGKPQGGEDNPNTTGVEVRGSNELLSTNAAAADRNLYSTDLSSETHSVVKDLLPDGDHQQYGLAFDAGNDVAYFTSLGAGSLSAYDFGTDEVTELLSGLGVVLGVDLSNSGNHIYFVERTGNKISSYEVATGTVTELVSGEGAHFGIGVWDDSEVFEPGEVIVHDDFSTGTIGDDLTTTPPGTPTSDGNGGWVNDAGRPAVYGGTEENKTFLSTGSGLAYAFLNTDVDAVENYSVELKNFHLSTDNMDGGSSFLLSTRRPGVEIGWAYDFRPVGESEATADDKIWEVSYIRDQGDPQKVVVGHIAQNDLDIASLELRVNGSWVSLYVDGERLDGPGRPTQGEFNDGTTDHALHLSLNSTESDSLNLEFEEVTVTVNEEPNRSPKRLWAYEPFDYNEGSLVGEDGGLGWSQAWQFSHESNRTDWPSAEVSSPGQTHGELETSGNKARLAEVDGTSLGGRAFRSIDVASLHPDQLDDAGNIGKTDTSAWISFIAEGNTSNVEDSGPFWGIAFFRDTSEQLFFGKSTGGEMLQLSGQGGSQQFLDDPISIDGKHFITIRVDFNEEGGHSAALFHNLDPRSRTPTDEDALGVYTGAEFDMAFNRIRLATHGGDGGSIDELRVGATWADVSPVPFVGLVNGDFEDEPFDGGWSASQRVTPHAPLAPGSTRGVFIPSGATSDNPINLLQNFPQWIEDAVLPRFDSITGQPLEEMLNPTGPEWTLGFYVASADPGDDANRSLNLLVGHNASDPEGTATNAPPQINFRITGDGAASAFHHDGGWQPVLPAGTFQFSELSGEELVDPEVYHLEIHGDYSGENPTYTVSARNPGDPEPFAVSDPIAAWQYANPEPGDGVVTVRYHGFVQAPYAIDEVTLTAVGGDLPADYADWADSHFGGDASNPAIAGADADPDGDGIGNLMEYALGLDPLAPSAGLLPMHDTMEHEGENYLTLTYTRPTDITGMSYTVEGSSDLATWQGGPVEVNSFEENGQETVLVRDAEPISESSRRFLRLNVTVD